MKLVASVLAVMVLATVLVPVPAVTAAQETQETQDPVAGGKVAFNRVCKACHGPEGKGDAAPTLVPFNREYDEVIAIVRDGYNEMPRISPARISDDEVKNVVAYLTSLSTDEKK